MIDPTTKRLGRLEINQRRIMERLAALEEEVERAEDAAAERERLADDALVAAGRGLDVAA